MDRFRPPEKTAAVVLTALSFAPFTTGVAYLPTEPVREPSRYAEMMPLDIGSAFRRVLLRRATHGLRRRQKSRRVLDIERLLNGLLCRLSRVQRPPSRPQGLNPLRGHELREVGIGRRGRGVP